MANLSVVVAFLFRIGTEETATFQPKALKSRITFGSLPIRKKVYRDPLQSTTAVSGESTTMILDDVGKNPMEVESERKDSNEAESLMPQAPAKPDGASDV